MKMELKSAFCDANARTEGANMQQPDDGKPPKSHGSEAASGDEHRDVHRQRTLKRARVVFADRSTIDCTIRDISKGGARLVFGTAFELPETFRLIIVTSSTIVPVRLQWQRGMEAGIAFTGPEEPAHSHL
jgi:PilZ domain